MIKKKSFDIYTALILRLLVLMLIFTLCRVIFYLLNKGMFSGIASADFITMMLGGLRFDLTAILYTNILYIASQIIPFKFRYNKVYQKFNDTLFYITNSLAIALNCVDIIYFRFTLRRTTWSVFKEFSNDNGNFALMFQFIKDYWYILIIWLVLVAFMVIVCKRIKPVYRGFIKNNILYYTASLVITAVFVGLFIGGIRGGFRYSTRPITISNANAYINKPVETAIVLNTPFSIYRTLERGAYPLLEYFDEENLNSIYTANHTPPANTVFTGKNVVVIIVESLSKEYIGSLNKDLDNGNYKGFTPFLDSLISVSYTSLCTFGNGLKSIDAMPSILASIPSFYDPYVLSIYSNNNIKALPALLAEQGYDCSFFHGAPNGSMGFDAFAKLAGFKHYYGKTEYNNDNDFDGRWGIWDEPFLNYMAQTLNTKKEPFMSAVFTISSHHPFIIPDKYKGVFDEGTLEIHKCIGYTDMALKRFFETASQMAWYKNTVFVITADHTNQMQYPKSKTSVGPFLVPIIFYDPSGDLKGLDENKTIQQIDIMPTTLGLIGYNKPYFAFGFDVLKQNSFAINYLNNVFQTYNSSYVLQSDENGPVALYNYKTDPLLSTNVINKYTDTVKMLDDYRKAFTQTYNERLNKNTTTFE